MRRPCAATGSNHVPGEARRPRSHPDQEALGLEDNLDALPTAAFLVDLDDLVLGWNSGAADLLGLPSPSAIGRRFRDLDVSYRIPKLRAALEELKREPNSRTIVDDVSFARGDGSIVIARIALAAAAGGKGRVVAVLVTLEDRTEHASLQAERDSLAEETSLLAIRHETAETRALHAAEELRTANEELTVLNEELQTRIGELEAAQAADRQKTEFLAILSHELRNPLAAVMNAVRVIRAQAPRDPVIAQAGRAVDRQVKHLARRLEDLLDVARIHQSKLELRKEVVDLAVAVAEAVEDTRHLIEAGRHRMSVAVPEGELMVEGDPTRLVQVIVNLLNNSARYTEPTGEISLTGHREGGHAVLRVKDTGLGIAPELLPKVFELFAQADTTLVRARGGLGVGLTLVRQLVEMHGGRVTAHSAGLGHGSEFVVRLPLATPSAKAAQVPPAPESRVALERLKILVIEDSLDAREMLRMALELEGHEVSVAMNGPEGVKEARTRAPDVIIIDIGLPGFDGYEVARQVRKSLGDISVLIALTGYGDSHAHRQAMEAGFDHHVVKPADPRDLVRLAGQRGPGRSARRPRSERRD